MTDIAVIYNFAEHPGGGDLVALDIIEALIENKYNVHLYTSYPQGLSEAIRQFSKDPKLASETEIHSVTVSKHVRHPYNIYLITKKMLNELKQYSLVIFFDDIPKPAQELKKVLVYVHYPHAARIILNQLVPYRYKYTLKGRLIWKIHSVLFRMFFLTNWDKQNVYVIVNSTLTQQHVLEALKPLHLTKIYPPVQVRQIVEYTRKLSRNKENLAVYIGRIQPEKGIEDIVKATALVRNRNLKVMIMGFGFDNKYLNYLMNLVDKLNLQKQVSIKVNASREEILETLARAKVLIHPAHYEPFGIAVVEGMAAGCIPIIRKGFNGPWIDIIEQGKFGLGFEDPSELAQILDTIINSNITCSKEITERALTFDEDMFKQKLIEHLREIA